MPANIGDRQGEQRTGQLLAFPWRKIPERSRDAFGHALQANQLAAGPFGQHNARKSGNPLLDRHFSMLIILICMSSG